MESLLVVYISFNVMFKFFRSISNDNAYGLNERSSGIKLKSILFLIFIFLTLFNFSFSQVPIDHTSKIISAKTIEAIEGRALKLLAKMKLNNYKKIFLYNLAGRELYLYGYYKKSKKYYKMAIDMRVKEDKTEAYFNIMAINYLTQNVDLKTHFVKAKSYFERSGRLKNKVFKKYILSYENSFVKNIYKINIKPKDYYTGFFGDFNKDFDFKREVLLGNYQKALSLINPKGLVQRDINTKIRHDVLRTLVYGRNTKDLLCSDILRKYPKSLTFTMEICRYLNAFIKANVKLKKDLNQIIERTKRENPRYLYLANALRKLRW